MTKEQMEQIIREADSSGDADWRAMRERLAVLRETMTPENCYRLVNEASDALEAAQTAFDANNTEETKAALWTANCHAHAVTFAVTMDIWREVDSATKTLLETAMDRLNDLPMWGDKDSARRLNQANEREMHRGIPRALRRYSRR